MRPDGGREFSFFPHNVSRNGPVILQVGRDRKSPGASMGTLRIGIPGIRPSTKQVEAVVNQQGNMVFQLAYHLMGSTPDAEDVVQTVFYKVYTNWFQVSRCSNKAAWIKRVTTNVCIDLLRKKKVRGPTVENSTLDRVIADDGGG